MYKYHCLNPISPVGMGQLDANYENTENAADADVILVRSAKMHEMEFGENLKAIARAGAGVNIFRWIVVQRKGSLYLILRERMRME